MAPSPDPPSTSGPREGERGRSAWIYPALALLVTLWVISFFVHCVLDRAPWPWDEAYLLLGPEKVVDAAARNGLLAALRQWYSLAFSKSPLSMLGTIVPIALFGHDRVSVRLDNVVVALLGAWFAWRFLSRCVNRVTAAVFATSSLTAPFPLAFVRTELAEIYVWTATLAYLFLLLAPAPLRSARRSAGLGAALAVGVLSKLSFPLLVAGPSLWVLVVELVRARRAGAARRLLGNVVVAGLVAVALIALVCGKSLEVMWSHLQLQYGWVGDQHGGANRRLDVTFLRVFLRGGAPYFGWIWAGAAALGLGAMIASLRAARVWPRHVGGSLIAGTMINVVSCYFFPVYDPRFMVGAFVSMMLLAAIVAGRALEGEPHVVSALHGAMIVTSAAFLLANTDVPGARRQVLDVPALRFNPLDRPNVDPDLRDLVLDRIPGARRVALAGDHRSLNLDSLVLRAFERRREVAFIQVGYFGAGLPVEEVVRRAGPVHAWVVVEPPAGVPLDLWTTRYARPVEDALAADVKFRRLAWTSTLPSDGSKVVLYQATAAGSSTEMH